MAEKFEELMNIFRQAGAGSILKIIEMKNSSKSCWLAEDYSCPYGSPQGRLRGAPVHYCIECNKIEYSREIAELFDFHFSKRERYLRKEIEDILGEEIKGVVRKEIKETLSDNMESLFDLLISLAEDAGEIVQDFVRVLDERLGLRKIKIIRGKNIKI